MDNCIKFLSVLLYRQAANSRSAQRWSLPNRRRLILEWSKNSEISHVEILKYRNCLVNIYNVCSRYDIPNYEPAQISRCFPRTSRSSRWCEILTRDHQATSISSYSECLGGSSISRCRNTDTSVEQPGCARSTMTDDKPLPSHVVTKHRARASPLARMRGMGQRWR